MHTYSSMSSSRLRSESYSYSQSQNISHNTTVCGKDGMTMTSHGSTYGMETASREYSYSMEAPSSGISTNYSHQVTPGASRSRSASTSRSISINDVLRRANSQGLLSNLRINKNPAPTISNSQWHPASAYSNDQSAMASSISLQHNTSANDRNPASGRWQTYVGRIVFHEYERAHTLYEHFHRIGEGVFARVYRAQRKNPRRQVALKVFTRKLRNTEQSFSNELTLF